MEYLVVLEMWRSGLFLSGIDLTLVIAFGLDLTIDIIDN